MILSIARKTRLLSQWQLGRQLGISQAKFSMLERGQICLSESEKRRIADILAMPVDAIEWPEARDREQSECQQADCQAAGG